MPYRSAPHTAQLENVPSTRPIGTAILHQLSASIRTKRTTCCLLIPRQRIIPKNRVRCAILLFIVPEIISTPASSTRTNSTPAMPYTVRNAVLLLCPAEPITFKFSCTASSPYCCRSCGRAFAALAALVYCRSYTVCGRVSPCPVKSSSKVSCGR